MIREAELSANLPDFYVERGEDATQETIRRLFRVLDHPYVDQEPTISLTVLSEEAPEELRGISLLISKPSEHRRGRERQGGCSIVPRGSDYYEATMNHARYHNPRVMTETVGSQIADYLEARVQHIEKTSGRLAVAKFAKNPS